MRKINHGKFFISLFLFIFLGFLFPHKALADSPHKTEITVKGDMDIGLGTIHNLPFGAERKNDSMLANQRLRFWITAQTSEHLSATLFLRIAPARWGQPDNQDGVHTGFGLGADGVNMRMRGAWINYHQPDTNFSTRFGIIPIAVPHESFFSGILFSTGAGVELNYKFSDALMATAFWTRMYDDYLNDSDGVH